MRLALFLLILVLSVASCAIHRSHPNPILVQPKDNSEVFTKLLRLKASRIDVEVTAVLGEHYATSESIDGPKLRANIIKALSSTDTSAGSPAGSYGNTLYRVATLSEAKRILARTWPESDFSAASEIGRLFKKYPRATVALMECDHQRIFFFDEHDQLVFIYPEGDGGC